MWENTTHRQQQSRGHQRQNSHQQQQWEGWNDFGSNHFSGPPQRQQQVKQSMHAPQSMRQMPTSRPQPQQSQQMQPQAPKLKPERIGRKLYRDAPPQTSSNSSNNNNTTMHARSRSTVRRTADLQRQLAQHAYTTTPSASDDTDNISVVSSVFLKSGSGGGESGASWGEEFGGSFHTSGSFGSAENNNTGGSGNGGIKKKKGLDALLNNSNNNKSSSRYDPNNSDNASVVSGTGSVAARRRAKAAWKNSPQRNLHQAVGVGGSNHHGSSSLSHVQEHSSMKQPVAALHPPPSTSSARRNMRMRMQNSNTTKTSSFSTHNNGSSFFNSTNNNTSDNNFNNHFNAFHLDSTIDDEVNHALNELKLDHPEMDFNFDHRQLLMERGHSRGTSGSGSVDSSQSDLNDGMHHCRNSGLGALGESSPKPIQQQQRVHSPVSTVGSSQKTLTTKSLTVESSGSMSRLQGGVVRSTPADTTNTTTNNHHYNNNNNISSHPSNKMIISPVISVERVESVERCSESSSLTDTSDWHTNGAAGAGGNNTAGTNMFKDANKGTFHKSKRIVRVGESISENREVSSEENFMRRDWKEEEGSTTTATIDENAVLPSIQDRISQFKSGNTGIPSPSHASTPPSSKNSYTTSLSKTFQKEESKEKSSVYSTSSSSSTVPTSYRSRNGLPPQAPTSSPFQVKLRKTKNSLEESPKDGSDGNGDVEETAGSSSFLSVKLRSTGATSWRERQQQTDMEVESPMERNDVVENHEDETMQEAAPLSEPTRKLTYREQQDLLKQQKQQQEENESSSSVHEEPKKDVATLIRERIAMNKQQNQTISSPKSTSGSELDIGALRGNLKKTSYGNRESITPTNRGSEEETPPKMDTTPSLSIHSPKEESEPTPKQALNAMLSSRLGTPPPTAEKKETDPSSDPRAALMAAIGNRAPKEDSPSHCRKEDSPPTADPRTALMASIGGKRSPVPDEEEEEKDVTDPKANLAAMLQNRIALSGGAAASNSAKQDVSAMLAKRAPPSPDVEEVGAADHGSDGRPALKDDPKYAKYFKMLKGENIFFAVQCQLYFCHVLKHVLCVFVYCHR